MLSALFVILRNPPIRVATIALFGTGLTFGATLPYLSLVAIGEFGVSDRMLSVLLFAIAVANLSYGVGMAIVSDLVQQRRLLLLVVYIAGLAGFGLIYAVPCFPVFVVCAILLVPLSNSAYSLLFASIRSTTALFGRQESAAVNQVVRATFAGAWVVAPGFIGLWLATAPSLLPAWGFSAVVCGLCLALVLLFMPHMPSPTTNLDSRGGFLASLKMITTTRMLSRVGSISLIMSANRLVAVIQPLLITRTAGGSVADVGLIAGACATLEIPFMILWGAVLRRLTLIQTLSVAIFIYAVFLLLLGFARTPWHFYLLVIPNACGLSAILSLPMSYYQDLFADRPGLGTSLNPMTAFVSTSMSAAAFAIGASQFGYAATAWLGLCMVLAGLAMLVLVERRSAKVDTDIV